MIFTRPQWKSWLVRGAFIISGYGAVLALHRPGGSRRLVLAAPAAAGLGLPLGGDDRRLHGIPVRARRRAAICGRTRSCRRTFLVQALLAGSRRTGPGGGGIGAFGNRDSLWLLSASPASSIC